MSTNLPHPLKSYFAAKNRHDIAAMLQTFSENALVRDEGRGYAGLAAIRAWMEETTRKYNDTAEVSGATTIGDRVRVTAIVSGDFPGSPVTLGFHFTFDNGRIARLEIGS